MTRWTDPAGASDGGRTDEPSRDDRGDGAAAGRTGSDDTGWDAHGAGEVRVERVGVGLLRTRFEDGLVLACNESAARMLGFESSHELRGRMFPRDHYVDQNDRKRMLEALRRSGSVRDYEARFRRADGSLIWLRVSVEWVREHGWIEGIIEDVTDRKRAEIALRESEERFRAIFETARDYVFVKDRDLRYTHVNPAMAALFGVAPPELVGASDDGLFDAETVERVREADLRVLEGQVEEQVNVSRVRGVEHVFHSVKVPLRDDSGAVVGLCGIARDITELKRAESLERTMGSILRAAVTTSDLHALIGEIRELLGDLIDTTNFFVALYDEPSGCYTFPFYADQYDVVEPDEIEALPKSLTDYVRRAGKPMLVTRDDFLRLQSSGEVELVGTDSVQWLGAPLTVGRRVIGVVAVQSYHDPQLYTANDIELLGYAARTISIAVERTRAEEERRVLGAQTLRSQKMESLGVLAGGVAHEFNNLLQGILGASGLASQMLPRDSAVHQQLAADKAARLTRQMLAYAGKGRFIVEDVDLSVQIEQAARYLAGSLPETAELRLDLAVGLPPIAADATEIRQMVSNLVTNAAEALGPGGGIVRVRTAVEWCGRPLLARAVLGEELKPGDYVVLEVADTGGGMSTETVGRVFDPFFSTKFTGRGLGLAAVLGIVRTNGGAIAIDSELGRGTNVRVLLPIHDAGTGESPASELPAAANDPGRLTVMVVDDDETIRSLTEEMLEQVGFSVVVAADGTEAVERLRRRPEAIDVVLLDLTMPGMSGEETYRELLRVRRTLPVIVASGYSEQDAMDRFRGAKPTQYLQKPYRIGDLKAAIDRARTLQDT
jgi:two-component system cell cycle sensor histidine kinase/response regulator CckA